MFGRDKNVKAARRAAKRIDLEAFRTALALVPNDRKHEVLDDALLTVVRSAPQEGTEAFVKELMAYGADVNQGNRGIILARAIEHDQATPVVKLLHDNGANFDDSLFIMRKFDWGNRSINRLKDKRGEITGSREKIFALPPESEEAKFRTQVLERLDNLAAQFNDLSERLARQEAGRAGQPAPAASAPYPNVR
jgi:hypothetical protein